MVTRLLVIAPSLPPGGVGTHIRCLALGAAQRGSSVVVLTGGHGGAVAEMPSLTHHSLDLASRTGIRTIHSHMQDCQQTLLIHSPETFHLAGLLADAQKAGVGVHGTPGTNSNWLGAHRHTIAAAAIQSLPGLPILVPGELYRPGIATEFSVGEDRVRALPNAIEAATDPVSPAGSAGILVPVRLANDKLWVLEAAIELAGAAGVPLHVVGSGIHSQDWRERLEQDCPTPWQLTVDGEVAPHIAAADVVVGAGLVAMEAAAAGRRVAVPSKTGGWLGVVTTASLPVMRSMNFVTWQTPEYVDPAPVWEQVAGLTGAELDAIAAAVRQECAPALMYDRLTDSLGAPGRADPTLVSISVSETVAESERDQQTVRRDFAEMVEARDYFQQQSANWEQAYRQLQPGAAEQPGSAPAGGRARSEDGRTAPGRLSRLAARAYGSHSLALHTAAALAHFAKKEAPARKRAGVPRRAPATIRRNESIPPLAWLGEYSAGKWDFVVGSRVEVSDRGFYEGVWDGDFGCLPPRDTEFAFGSGVLRTGGRPRFLSSRNSASLIYVLRRVADGRICVSNSLVFALTAAGVPVDGAFAASLRDGLRNTIKANAAIGVYKTPTRLLADDQYSLDAVSFFDFHLSGKGVITRRWSWPHRYFSDFASYQDFTRSTLERLLANAQSPLRRQSYQPLALMSRGYDSVASAVLARAAGLRQAGTLAVSVEGRPDDARSIAAQLDLQCTVHEHVLGRDVAGLDFNAIGPLRETALEFLTEGGVGLDLMLVPFQDRLQSSLLVSGAFGDSYFERNVNAESGFVRHPFGGPSMAEFRLRVGFPVVPVPLLGMRFTPPVVDLNRSTEMAPYSVGGDYDRPVFRRIGEEAGLDRSDFGVAKTAVSPILLNAEDAYLEAIATVGARYRDWRD